MSFCAKCVVAILIVAILVAGVTFLWSSRKKTPEKHQGGIENNQDDNPLPGSRPPNEKRAANDGEDENTKSTRFDKGDWSSKIDDWIAFAEPSKTKVLSISEAKAADLDVPFVSKLLEETPLVSVEMRVDLISFGGKTSPRKNKLLNKAKCAFVADTGQLVQIEIQEDGIGELPGEMSAESAEERYGSTGETYHGLPLEKPPAKFQDILNRVSEVGLASVWDSKRIIVRYVINSRKDIFGKEPRWIVSFYGFPPMPPLGMSKSTDEERSHLRYLFSKEGKFLRADNRP